VLSWAVEEYRALALEAIDVRYSRYRLSVLEAEEAMARSLRRYGQLSPVVVCLREEVPVLIDGFKRLAAARGLKGFGSLSARRIEVDERHAKAAMYGLNRTGRHFGELEEAWLVQALVREDGLSQIEVAELLGRHKSWVCRRLAMMEKLCGAAQEDLRLGLLSPTMARQLVRLPAGNQQEALETGRRHSLSAAELRGVVDLLLASGTREKETFVLTLDFTQEGRRKVNLFSYVLGHSRRQYLHFTASQDLETTLREHVRAFEHLGGVAVTCLYDNMKVVVARYEDGEPIYNTRFLAFATHYGFRPVACRRRRPQTKGKVERPFYFVETNLLSGREFRNLEHLNDVTAWWLSEVADVRVHRQTRRRPIDMHVEELPHLIPLPERPYEVAEVVYRTVDAEGMVSYGQNRYSAPWQYIGQVLPLRITDEQVTIYGPHLEVLARHLRFPPTARHRESRQAEHLPPRDIEQRREALRERFAQLGPVAVRFLEGLLQVQRCGWGQAQKVLALLGTYRRDDVLAALDRAVRYGAFAAKSIERILAVQARPKTCWDRLAEEDLSHLKDLLSDDPTPPRPATDYQHLLFEDSDHHDETKEDDPDADDDGQPCGQPA